MARRFDKYLYSHGLCSSQPSEPLKTRRKFKAKGKKELKKWRAKPRPHAPKEKTIACTVFMDKEIVSISISTETSWKEFIRIVEESLDVAHVSQVLDENEEEVWSARSLEPGKRYRIIPSKRDAIFRDIVSRIPSVAPTPPREVVGTVDEAEREAAERAASKARKLLDRREKERQTAIRMCENPHRDELSYFKALDKIESLSATRGEELREIFRRSLRWLANAALSPGSAAKIVKYGACQRVLKYVGEDGCLLGDSLGLKYSLYFFTNLALLYENKALCKLPLKYGMVAIALDIMRQPEAEYSEKRLDGEEGADVETQIDQTQLHWCAASLVLALLRGPHRSSALSALIQRPQQDFFGIIHATLSRWSRYRRIVLVHTWLLQELVKEGDVVKNEDRARRPIGFGSLLQVSRTRHRDVEEFCEEIDVVLKALDFTEEERRCADAVGAIEDVRLDDDDQSAAYLGRVLQNKGLGKLEY